MIKQSQRQLAKFVLFLSMAKDGHWSISAIPFKLKKYVPLQCKDSGRFAFGTPKTKLILRRRGLFDYGGDRRTSSRLLVCHVPYFIRQDNACHNRKK